MANEFASPINKLPLRVRRHIYSLLLSREKEKKKEKGTGEEAEEAPTVSPCSFAQPGAPSSPAPRSENAMLVPSLSTK